MLIYSSDASGNLTAEAPGTLAAPLIVGQPVDQLVSVGDFASFSVVVANTSGVTFQWAFDGTDIPGASGDSLLLPAVSAANVGQYSVTVTNSAGSVTSSPGTLAHESSQMVWYTLDKNPATKAVIAGTGRSAGATPGNRLYQLHNDNKIWEFSRPGSTAGPPPHYGWIPIDRNPATKAITAAGNNLFQLRDSGEILRYTGTPHGYEWVLHYDEPATTAITATENNLYALHSDGEIWRYTLTPPTGRQLLGDDPATNAITAAGNNLYQLRDSGEIWRYTETPLTGWELLDDNPATRSIVAAFVPAHPDPPRPAEDRLYQLRDSGEILRYTGTPDTGWQVLWRESATRSIAAYETGLLQLHASGLVWEYLGLPITGWKIIGSGATALAVGVPQSLTAVPQHIASGVYVRQANGTIQELIEIIH